MFPEVAVLMVGLVALWIVMMVLAIFFAFGSARWYWKIAALIVATSSVPVWFELSVPSEDSEYLDQATKSFKAYCRRPPLTKVHRSVRRESAVTLLLDQKATGLQLDVLDPTMFGQEICWLQSRPVKCRPGNVNGVQWVYEQPGLCVHGERAQQCSGAWRLDIPTGRRESAVDPTPPEFSLVVGDAVLTEPLILRYDIQVVERGQSQPLAELQVIKRGWSDKPRPGWVFFKIFQREPNKLAPVVIDGPLTCPDVDKSIGNLLADVFPLPEK